MGTMEKCVARRRRKSDKKEAQPRGQFAVEELERRILLSTLTGVDPDSDAWEQLEHPAPIEQDVGEPDSKADGADSDASALNATAERRLELVFVDTGVEGYEALVDDLRSAPTDGRTLEVFLLDAERDGVEQISDILADYAGLDAIHIVSHGSEGAVQLGSTRLSGDTLSEHENALAGWREALADEADLLFYGCDLAGGESGTALVASIAKLTGADVAASDDLTGTTALGGDWTLEHESGAVETSVAFDADTRAGWTGVLADWVYGTAGDDTLAGTAGVDWIDGLGGDDVIAGGDGDDLLVGGAGSDTVDYSDAAASVTVDLTVTAAQDTGGGGIDTLSGFERVIGPASGGSYKFTNPVDGASYHVDAGGYAFDSIDLTNFSAADISFGTNSVTLDMGGGESFTITYEDVRYMYLSDAKVKVNTGIGKKDLTLVLPPETPIVRRRAPTGKSGT